VPGNLHIVFNRPPVGVTDSAFNEWAYDHFDEILQVPGWHSARRYRLAPDVRPVGSLESFAYMSVYEIDDDAEVAVAAMHHAGDEGKFNFPQWFRGAQEQGCFAAWSALPLKDPRNHGA
jgi:hypothetical protein